MALTLGSMGELRGCTFTRCAAESKGVGGAVKVSSSRATLIECSFIECVAAQGGARGGQSAGGAVLARFESDLALSDCVFDGCMCVCTSMAQVLIPIPNARAQTGRGSGG